jgi:hypothetical protein
MKERGVERPRLALDLGEWKVRLLSGHQIELRAHAFVEDQTDVVFSVLMDGDPAYYVDVFRIPRSLVADIVGG